MANGSICGGIITESEFQKRLKDNKVEGEQIGRSAKNAL